MPPQGPYNVLVVDDESEVADAYALRLKLQDEYDVDTAYGGEAALDRIDADVDVVLLDRRMPNVSGDDVLDYIHEEGFDCRVIMVTAVDPDFGIAEMPFDDYLCKPIDKEDLLAAIEQQISLLSYDATMGDYLSLAGKIGLLEAEMLPEELEESEEYARLTERAAELREELDESVEGFDDFEMAFQDIDRHADA